MELTIVGDVVVGGWPRRAPEESALGLLQGGDLVIGNLEVPLTDGGERAEKLVAMRAPAAGAAELASWGVGLVSLAMNHAMDYGAEGMRDTVRALDAVGIAHAGFGENRAEATAARIVQVGEERLAFLSLCSALPLGANATATRAGIAPLRVRQTAEFDGPFLEETPGTPPFVHTVAHEPDVRVAEEAIREARSRADVVVVALHWGVPFPYLPAAQGPLAQYQQPLARRLVDAGADLIVGHHPHCLHPVEFYGRGLILYSTGNFVFDWCEGWTPEAMVPDPDAHPAAPFRPVLMRGPWYESAVFRVGIGGAHGPRLRLDPIELDADSQPIPPRPAVAAAILAGVERDSRELDPTVVVDADGVVWRRTAETVTPSSSHPVDVGPVAHP
ncbi:CapA family protein [Pseudonocardia sp. WMMC193]|uniref:CapA family protein n=1 Tax=Pseudonocardia sp. WMMC193 TaxID=2911965 RepID=UPI001F1BC303|nr:CapA family protein [Pseudonocardia sp. WMMC193]MCF7553688.1 CapA family protein [Pseudonocardia sp. WMMC193]